MRRPANQWMLLLLTPLLWGATFPASKLALRRLPPLTFMAWTRGTGLLAILAMLALLGRARDGPRAPPREVILPGLFLGALIFAGYVLQTEGLARTTSTNAGFITGLYVVFTPVLASLLFRHRVPAAAWASVVVSVVGFALLSVRNLHAAHLRPGDLLVLAGDVAWAGHILAVSRFSPRFDPWLLSVAQMGATTALHVLAASATGPRLDVAWSASVWPLLMVTGVLGTGVAFTIQLVAQRTLTATRAAVLLAAEAVFAAAFSAAWLGERLLAHQWVGALLVLAAMAYSELAARRAAPVPLEPAP